MLSTSMSSVQRSFKYDVFLSFRGEDVRKSFVDHLYKALNDSGIILYKDDIRMVKGKAIDNQLITAIKDSKFHIIIFSKNYANSAWCLDELVHIMECQNTGEQTAYPIFYDVQPTEVRNQSGAVGEAFAVHVKKNSARRWRYALTKASKLAGWELKNTGDGHEVQFIKKVVEDVLQNRHYTNFSIDSNLVGMATRIAKLLSFLHLNTHDVRMIGIKGMGGVGKTTLARAIFDHISSRFEGKSFVENVSERSKGSRLQDLQKQVLSSVFNNQYIVVTGVYEGKILMKRMMPRRKALVVLDDIDHIEQLEALVGDPTSFKLGSRIIITTRNEQVLVAYGVQMENIYDVDLLSDEEAMLLFSRYAFRRECPIQGYEDLLKSVVSYAAGLPLTIKNLGTSLCGIPKDKWNVTIDRLTTPSNGLSKRLGISSTDDPRPDIKRARFSFEEEDKIIQLHGVVGNKWSLIAARLAGRTDNESRQGNMFVNLHQDQEYLLVQVQNHLNYTPFATESTQFMEPNVDQLPSSFSHFNQQSFYNWQHNLDNLITINNNDGYQQQTIALKSNNFTSSEFNFTSHLSNLPASTSSQASYNSDSISYSFNGTDTEDEADINSKLLRFEVPDLLDFDNFL